MLSSTVQLEVSAPHNMWAMPAADVIGMAGRVGEGPYLYLFASVADNKVREASFQTYNCPNAIACGSWVTRWMEGRSADTLALLTADDLIRILGGLPVGKRHCAVLAVTALGEAIRQWNESTGSEEPGNSP